MTPQAESSGTELRAPFVPPGDELLSKARALGLFLSEELKPFPGRALSAARIVAAVTITMILSETLRVPFPDFSAYLVFFVANDDSARSLKLGFAAMVAVTLALATAIAIDICFMDAPWFRVPATLFLVGGAVWLSRVLAVGAIGRLLAVILALNLSLADTIFEPEMLTRTTLWLWSVSGLAIGVTVLVNLLIRGRPTIAPEAAEQKSSGLVNDAFSNPEYLKFAAKTLLAVFFCELFLNAVAWPGIRTSMVTCVVTALATLESQTQKQMLRLIGAGTGGLVGLGAIVYIVPHLDTIAGLALLAPSLSAGSRWEASDPPMPDFKWRWRFISCSFPPSAPASISPPSATALSESSSVLS
jgi:uncharacterized membrane protein YccC